MLQCGIDPSSLLTFANILCSATDLLHRPTAMRKHNAMERSIRPTSGGLKTRYWEKRASKEEDRLAEAIKNGRPQ
jgi:hypothetical protein